MKGEPYPQEWESRADTAMLASWGGGGTPAGIGTPWTTPWVLSLICRKMSGAGTLWKTWIINYNGGEFDERRF